MTVLLALLVKGCITLLILTSQDEPHLEAISCILAITMVASELLLIPLFTYLPELELVSSPDHITNNNVGKILSMTGLLNGVSAGLIGLAVTLPSVMHDWGNLTMVRKACLTTLILVIFFAALAVFKVRSA